MEKLNHVARTPRRAALQRDRQLHRSLCSSSRPFPPSERRTGNAATSETTQPPWASAAPRALQNSACQEGPDGTAVRRLSCLGAYIHSGLSKTTNFLCTQPHWPSTLQEIDTPPTPGYNLVFSRISSPCNIRPCTPVHQTNRQEQKQGFFFLKWGSFQSEFR